MTQPTHELTEKEWFFMKTMTRLHRLMLIIGGYFLIYGIWLETDQMFKLVGGLLGIVIILGRRYLAFVSAVRWTQRRYGTFTEAERQRLSQNLSSIGSHRG